MAQQALQLYFDCLNHFSSEPIEEVGESDDLDFNLVKNLIEEGCLSAIDATTFDGMCFANVSITPKGAVILAEWGALLRTSSLKGQFMDTLGKLVWLVAGIAATVAGALILKVIE